MNLLALPDGDSSAKAARLLDAVQKASQKNSAGHVRAASRADMPAIGELFQRTFAQKAEPAPQALTNYLCELFLDAPDRDPDIVSKVHVRGDGQVNGFIGVLSLPLNFEGRSLRGAVCGSLMVDERDGDPFAGARLMRSFLSGPQDISLSETANPVSENMWRKLRGTVLPAYSLEWVRILRPTGFAIDVAARSTPLVRLLHPLAVPLDGMIRRFGPSMLRAPQNVPAVDREINRIDLAALIASASFPELRFTPPGAPSALRQMLADASQQSRYGTFIARAVHSAQWRIRSAPSSITPNRAASRMSCRSSPSPGKPVRCSTGSSFNAEQLAPSPCAAAAQPALLDALLTRHCFHVHRASSLVHARDIASRAFPRGARFLQWPCRRQLN